MQRAIVLAAFLFGEIVYVTDVDGHVFKGTVLGVSDVVLELRIGPIQRVLTQAEVQRIERRRHTVRDGMVMGFLIGFVAGAVTAGVSGDSPYTRISSGPGTLAFGGLFGAVGMGAGAAVGLSLSRERLIYERIVPGRARAVFVPVVTPERAGLRVGIVW